MVILKRLRRPPSEYASRQPHVVAARLGAEGRSVSYLFINTESRNPYLRVMPASMLAGQHHGYDRGKYAALVRRAAENLLRPLNNT